MGQRADAREIFGPILPVVAYDTLDEVIERINSGPRPLALYPFSHDRARIDRLLTHVMSGGVSINDALFHVGQHDLPFGGIGESGMGHYHGREGFQTFSKLRPIFHQARLEREPAVPAVWAAGRQDAGVFDAVRRRGERWHPSDIWQRTNRIYRIGGRSSQRHQSPQRRLRAMLAARSAHGLG